MKTKMKINQVIYFQRINSVIGYYIKYPVIYGGKHNPIILKFNLN